MAIKNSHEIIKEMVADDYINGLLKDHDMRADMERAELQTTEQRIVYDYLSDFMKDNNGQGLELTEPDLLASFRQAKLDTGYFMEQEQGMFPPEPAMEMER
jgi:hypothetical protein